ncbi:MAG TPA: hypothetical protein VKI61_03520, partial [Chitinophagaceae bacterium]|nr:hypothetical protein [Chitinophagaceae bacterium]
DGLAPGTYYIKVQNFSTTEFANYTITDSLFTTSLANDIEQNGTAAGAVVLPLNNKLTGHVGYYYNHLSDTTDWYKVTTTSDGLLRVYLTTDSGSIYSTNSSNGTNPLDVNVWLYDNDGTTQLGNVEVFNGFKGATNFLTKDGLAAGTYYIKVQNFSTSEFANYTITDSLFTAAVTNDVESNGTPATAHVFPLNSNIKGHVGYYYDQQRDTADWYKITTSTNGPLHIYLGMQKGSIYSTASSTGTDPLDMTMAVFNSDGTTEIAFREVFNGYGPATDSIVFATLNAGTYFVKVTNFSTNEFAVYSLTNFVTSASGSLPVNFINFDGVLQGGKALLSWNTATEINNKGFEVERSADGQNYTGIGFVNGHGSSSAISAYTFTDASPLNGAGYYRLKQIDLDGNFVYSTIIRLDNKHFDWTIFGNPVTTNSWLQLQLQQQAHISIRVSSMDGKILQNTDKGILTEGSHAIALNLGALAHGTYIITLVKGEELFSKLIVR